MPSPTRRMTRPRLDYRAAVLASPGLSGYYRLGDLTGTVARDEMGKNHGVYTGTPTLGVVGGLTGDPDKAVTVAAGKYASTFPSSLAAMGRPRSIIAWVNMSGTTRGGIAGTTATGPTRGWGFVVNRTTAGNLTYQHSGLVVFQVAGGLVTGTWFQVAFTDTFGVAELFVNGVSFGTATGFTDSTASPFNGVIGDESTDLNQPFPGTVDEVAIWNRALTKSEVFAFYRIGRGIS